MTPLSRLLRSVLLGVLVCLGQPLLASSPSSAVAPASIAPPTPLLWKVIGPRGALYLLGSFHLLKPEDYPLAHEVDAAYAASTRLLFELAPKDVDSPQLGAQMLQAAQRHDGKRLQDDLDPATWQRLRRYAAGHGLPLAQMSGLEPWFVGLSISIADMKTQGLQADAGLDRHFMEMAVQAGKSVEGLESASTQIALLQGMDPVEQRQMLTEALDDAEQGATQTLRLHDAWRGGDERQLWQELGVQMKHDYPRLYQRIDVERNRAWLPRLEQRLQDGQGDTLVVVGALHLLGPDGVVEGLRARGYKVERLCAGCRTTPARQR
ncbi:TraB/GumN family protein [Xanthomonas albilineans]|uniref:TraB/GumN family protein n=1 Tax=Xanthomonas albilineans TaxID=29447 RepID=UPI0005F33D69|nr:TraB/GumN family protein [Xanthomonas albilineans]